MHTFMFFLGVVSFLYWEDDEVGHQSKNEQR